MMNRKTTKPLKIFLLGARSSIHLVKWANGLDALGHNVVIASHHTLQGDPLNSRVEVISLPFKGAKGYILNLFALKQALRDIQPDIFHVHYATGYGLLGTMTGYQPRMVSVWGSDIYNFPHKSILHKSLLGQILASAQIIGSTSNAMAVETLKTYPELKDKLRVTPFGVDTNQFKPLVTGPNNTNNFVIGTVKSLSPKYGIDLLIRGFAHFKNELKRMQSSLNIKLLIAGDGPQKSELMALSKELGIEEGVEFRGLVSHQDVPQTINEMDLFVALSQEHSESFGVAVVEASACAKPVVVSNYGGLPEVVEHNKTGFVLDDTSPQNLATYFLKFINDPISCHNMGQSGRRLVLDNYSWQASLKAMLEAYLELLRFP
jgi:L-malate glycosyltransferase